MRLKWIHLNDQCKDQINQLKELFINVRCGNTDSAQIDQALQYHNQTTLNELSETLNREVAELEAKRKPIAILRRDNIEYCNVAPLNVSQNDYEQILLRKTITNNKDNVILCASDILKEKNPSMLAQLRDQLLKDRRTNQELHLIYADFSYCALDLPNMMRLPLMKESNTAEQQKQHICSSKTDEIINILLLGETGVGKSTFINAFVNYLTLDTLEHAQSNPPLVVIPVSFLITTGNNFQEHTVKFGDSDALHNEDFDHSGQSVTQHCKSYVFHLHHNGGRKVCIIDTPGFGDTRGVEQDDRNMEGILDYINHLTHLNGICFLFKSNTTQINQYFQVCLSQLFEFLGPDIRQNITFCFTNSRSTFYTPGDTSPVLNKMLKSFPIRQIPFKKENTFCFDSESFRYLVALENSIEFNDLDKQEYAMSWSKSRTGAKRLMEYICTQFNAYFLNTKPQSIRHAQLMISPMIRPILETLRNLLRNLVVREMKSSHKSIELQTIVLHRPAAICLSCKHVFDQAGSVLIIYDEPHEFLQNCLVCSCSPNCHTPVYHAWKYHLVDTLAIRMIEPC